MSRDLREDYERLVVSGLKRIGNLESGSRLHDDTAAALGRLIEAGLAAREGDSFVLRHPRDADTRLSGTAAQFMETLHAVWLRMDDDSAGEDEILYGEIGYWQHWWNSLNDGTDRSDRPLKVDLSLPEDGSFLAQDWTQKLDPEIVQHVFSNSLVDMRVIVPASTQGSPAEGIVEESIGRGVEIRVFPSRPEFSIYDGHCVVVRDPVDADGVERHRLIRRRSMVEPLVHLFETRWASAIPWESFVRGGDGILQLLAQGWTDVRIANAIGTSPRTVSRRIAEMMTAADVQSRFQLGMRFSLQELESRRSSESAAPG